jgi:hypothetical protein
MSTRQQMLAATARPVAATLQSPQRAEPVRHLNQEQLARRWQISPRTLERHRWLGTGVAYLKLNGRVAYRLEDVLAYEAANLHCGTR